MGGFAFLFFRAYRKWSAYLQWFEPVDGVPLNMIHTLVGNRFGNIPVQAARRQAHWTRQADPEMERLRRAGWRAMILMVVWIFVAPSLLFATLIWLNSSGALR